MLRIFSMFCIVPLSGEGQIGERTMQRIGHEMGRKVENGKPLTLAKQTFDILSTQKGQKKSISVNIKMVIHPI